MLICASKSPRRKELLEMAGLTFACIPAVREETVPEGMAAEEEPEYLARRKAEEVAASHPEDVVLGSDTLVILDGKPLGKPHTEEEAYAMLSALYSQSSSSSSSTTVQEQMDLLRYYRASLAGPESAEIQHRPSFSIVYSVAQD